MDILNPTPRNYWSDEIAIDAYKTSVFNPTGWYRQQRNEQNGFCKTKAPSPRDI